MKDKQTQNYARRKYEIIPYNIDWQKQFADESQKIQAIFGDVSIEHIGSTSVNGMFGKPCIDLLIILDNLDSIEKYTSQMETIGYSYAGDLVTDDAVLFRKMKDDSVLANAHFFPAGHVHVKEMLGMRDYLRSHPGEVLAYSNLKKFLYEKYPNDYASYRKEKDIFMAQLIKRQSYSDNHAV